MGRAQERRFSVFGLGQCSLDYLVRIETYPRPDAKCEFHEMVVQGGGPVATALVALSRWGVSGTFAGVIGDDDFGARIRDSLEVEGVDLAGLVVRAGAASQFAFIAAEPGRGTRTVFWRRPTGNPLSPQEIDVDRLGRADLFYTDGLMIDAALEAAALAARCGIPVFVDAGTVRAGMLELARFSDVFIASGQFSQQLVGREDPLTACRELAALGPRLVGVTLGDRGYVARENEEVIEGAAHPVAAIDTTGCGDVFHAGVAYGLLQGWSTRRGLDFAAWAASRVATRLGGRSGIPPREDYHAAGDADAGTT